MNDYYATLGVSRDASPDEIKKAYRRLVRESHPDVAGGSDEQIKQVNQAYEVLSSPEKRQAYDLGADPFASAGAGMGGFGFSDLFESFFAAASAQAGAQRGPAPRQRPGQDALVEVAIDLPDAVFGTQRTIDIDTAVLCPTCGGSCCQEGFAPETCRVCGGRGMTQRTVRSFIGNVVTTAPCTACGSFGTVIPHPCPDCGGEGRVRTRAQIPVDIPAGVDTGARIRLAGRGEVGPGGGPAGDLYVELRVRKHPDFVRKGDDLHCTAEIPMTAAALGATLSVETFDGIQEIDVRPGAQPASTVTLKGLGVGRLRGQGRGDLTVHLDVQIPTRLDDAQRALLADLAALRGEERPEARIAPANPGFFDRLKDRLAGR